MSNVSARTASMPAPASQQTNVRRRSIFYGWWVVLACAVGLFLGSPVSVFSFPVFLKPLMQDFHAGHAAVSLGFTLNLMVVAVSAPWVGWLIDRYGTRRVILWASATFSLILLLNRGFSANIRQFYFFCIALGLVGNGVGPMPYGSVVSHWFDRRRGLTLGLMMIGIGSGAMIMPSFAQDLAGAQRMPFLAGRWRSLPFRFYWFFLRRSRRTWDSCPTERRRGILRLEAKLLRRV